MKLTSLLFQLHPPTPRKSQWRNNIYNVYSAGALYLNVYYTINNARAHTEMWNLFLLIGNFVNFEESPYNESVSALSIYKNTLYYIINVHKICTDSQP